MTPPYVGMKLIALHWGYRYGRSDHPYALVPNAKYIVTRVHQQQWNENKKEYYINVNGMEVGHWFSSFKEDVAIVSHMPSWF